MYVAGLDARYKLPHDRGTSYLAFGYYNMTKALYLAPALEVMHSTGGRGMTENFLGLDGSDDGTGQMYTLADRQHVQGQPADGRPRVRHGHVGALAAGRRDGRAEEQGSPALLQVGRRAELPAAPEARACRRASIA